jgi:hypothetical protein
VNAIESDTKYVFRPSTDPLVFIGLYGIAIVGICVFFFSTSSNSRIDFRLRNEAVGLLWTILLAFYPYASYQFALWGSAYSKTPHSPELWSLVFSGFYVLLSVAGLVYVLRYQIREKAHSVVMWWKSA